MLEKLNTEDMIKFSKVSPEEKESRGILGRLSGPIASCVVPTRNGRQYSDKLWENVFNSDLVKELFACGGLPGELDHPVDRSETDSTKIAVMMPNPPKKDNKGRLIASLDIVDTPCGKIAYQLAKYGFKFGISSRGEGDFTEDYEGNQVVDPNTYELKAFDLVLLPACKDARLTMTESLNTKKYNKTLRESLQKIINEASEDDKKIMENTLKGLDIELEEKQEPEHALREDDAVNAFMDVTASNDVLQEEDSIETHLEEIPEEGDKKEECDCECNHEEDDLESSEKEPLDIKADEIVGEIAEVDDDESDDEMIEQFQELLKAKKTLEEKLMDLQNKLAVSDAKVDGLNEELNKYKNATMLLSNKAAELKESQAKVAKLQEALKQKNDLLKKSNQKLTESVKSEGSVKLLNEKLKTSYDKLKISNEEIEKLNSQITDIKADYDLKESLSEKKLTKAKSLIRDYKQLANDTMNRYIESKANMIGVNSNEIRNKLDEKYTVDDVDRICESLTSYKVNLSRLPISIPNNVKVKVKESVNESLSIKSPYDDTIDEDLISLAKL